MRLQNLMMACAYSQFSFLCRCRSMLFLSYFQSYQYKVCFCYRAADSLYCARCAGWTTCSLALAIGMPNRWCSGQEGQIAGRLAIGSYLRALNLQVDLLFLRIYRWTCYKPVDGSLIAQREQHRLGQTIYNCCWWGCNLTSLTERPMLVPNNRHTPGSQDKGQLASYYTFQLTSHQAGSQLTPHQQITRSLPQPLLLFVRDIVELYYLYC